jgi:hypothetical protein
VLQVPNVWYGLHFAPAATSIVFLGPGLEVVAKANASRRKYVVGLPIVASKRLLATLSLNHSLAVPEFLPLPVQALRTYNLMLTVSPDWNVTPGTRVRGIVSCLALLNPLLPPGTLATSPDPTN